MFFYAQRCVALLSSLPKLSCQSMLFGRRSPPPDAPPSPRSEELCPSEEDVDEAELHAHFVDAPPTAAAPSAPPGGACSECGAGRLSAQLLQHFRAKLCYDCGRLPAHGLVSKTDAKEAYSLSDSQLRALQCLVKASKLRRDGTVCLYMRSQLAALAASIHGGADGTARERAKRQTAKRERAAKKRQAVRAKAADGDPEALQQLAGDDAVAMELLGRSVTEAPAPGKKAQEALRKLEARHKAAAPHVHSFAAAGGCQVCTACGAAMEVEVETM